MVFELVACAPAVHVEVGKRAVSKSMDFLELKKTVSPRKRERVVVIFGAGEGNRSCKTRLYRLLTELATPSSGYDMEREGRCVCALLYNLLA